ncbi:MAG: DUF951 domain-containing protein [Xylanivirga thermophila]|jgi:hypothetical protein|uniref:DUF951 domain-containing protein n=1 Tax=Xylanivirga thermophila TaxID=2496273 RepID=UPI00101C3100|nr:DUF951 domain-containing protein [Xylanivirga thermophila]
MMEFAVGDIIQTKKKHPCGSDTWSIMRLGADVKIKCTGCGRIVMMDREHFEKRAKRVVEKADE